MFAVGLVAADLAVRDGQGHGQAVAGRVGKDLTAGGAEPDGAAGNAFQRQINGGPFRIPITRSAEENDRTPIIAGGDGDRSAAGVGVAFGIRDRRIGLAVQFRLRDGVGGGRKDVRHGDAVGVQIVAVRTTAEIHGLHVRHHGRRAGSRDLRTVEMHVLADDAAIRKDVKPAHIRTGD